MLLAPGRRVAEKPGMLVAEDVELEVRQGPDYVSRGGIKLANALDATGFDVSGRHALDVGASTGGFTDCLLQRGAPRVICVDVGYGQLDWRLRNDSRVTVIERRNARSLSAGELPYAPDLIVIDASFISVTKLLGAVTACAAPEFDCLALIKPQFEVGRGNVGQGGVVRDPEARRRALLGVGEHARRMGLSVLGYASSGLPGPKGNRETFVWLADSSRRSASELAPLLAGVEP